MSQIDEVRERTDIVELLRESGVVLQKAGRNLKACCPFHTEKTPSFIVFPERQNWRCFGACATGGDAFSYVMKRDNVGFGEALRTLAQRAGITLETRASTEDEDDRRQRDRLRTANKLAAEFYVAQLASHPAATIAREYLEKRHLTQATLDAFQIGFAPDEWHALENHLIALGFEKPELVAAGLLTENEEGRVWDRFRNKIMFPINDRDGQCIGFGSRVLDNSQPKYINSPQTPLFDKSATLYGLDKAREAIRREGLVVLVEGYMDAIMAHQAGFANVVATLGTALTDRHVTVLKRMTKRIALCLDGDQAGVNAMLRGYEVARDAFDQKATPIPTARGLIRYQTTADADIRVVLMPWGKDPDEVIHEDPDLWKKLVFDAQPVVDFIFSATMKMHSNRDPAGKRAIVDALAPVVSDIPDPVSRGHYLQRLATAVQMDERQLAAYIASQRPRQRQGAAPASTSAGPPTTLLPRDRYEEAALALLLRYPQLRRFTSDFNPELFDRPENRALYEAWRNCETPDSLEEVLEPSLREQFGIVLRAPAPPLEPGLVDSEWSKTHRALQRRWLSRQYEAMRSVVAEVEASTSPDAIAAQTYQTVRGQASDPVSDDLRQLIEIQTAALAQTGEYRSLVQKHPAPKRDPQE